MLLNQFLKEHRNESDHEALRPVHTPRERTAWTNVNEKTAQAKFFTVASTVCAILAAK